MSTKNLGGINALLGEAQEKRRVGRPQSPTVKEDGLPIGKSRATFVLFDGILDKIKGIAYWERLTLQEVVNEALEETVKKYEKAKGEIQPIPQRKKR